MSKQSDKHSSYFELRDALGLPGCAVCRLAEKSVLQFLDTFMYENVTNPTLRLTIRDGRGFCSAHSWQLVDLGGVSGIAILYRDLVNAMITPLETAADQPLAFLSTAAYGNAADGGESAIHRVFALRTTDENGHRKCSLGYRRRKAQEKA